MSDLSIGLVVEGPTDAVVIEAGLKHFLDRPFTYVTLKPQVAPGVSDKGWGGVFHWCREVASAGGNTLEDNPSLGMQDLVIIQVDADVAGFDYNSARISLPVCNDLPCEKPCPPASDTVDALSKVVKRWLNPLNLGTKGVLCIPSKCTEAWIVAGLYGKKDRKVVDTLECNLGILNYLHAKPACERLVVIQQDKKSKKKHFKKKRPRYLTIGNKITEEWGSIEEFCPQAKRFREAVQWAIG